MKVKCLIVDDEPLAINVIKSHLKSFENFEVTGSCGDAMEAFNFIKTYPIDLVFLDINMPELSGMDFIRNLEQAPLIIITTAYREFAVEGFELNVFDYLVKPISFPRFVKSIDKFLAYSNIKTDSESNEIDYAFIKVDKKIVKVFYNDILYIESLKDYVRIVTQAENYITHQNLGAFTASLPQAQFLRIHRSYTISLSKIKALDGNNIEIANKQIPIGRNYQVEIKKQILNQP